MFDYDCILPQNMSRLTAVYVADDFGIHYGGLKRTSGPRSSQRHVFLAFKPISGSET